MPSIRFERYERDCGANETAKKTGSALIYDFRVMIDNQFRAIMSREYTGKGYRIFDADHRAIHKVGDTYLPKHRGSVVEKQDYFEQVVSECLEAGLIPTLLEMSQKRIAEDKAAEREATDEAYKQYKLGVESCALDLLELCKEIAPDQEPRRRARMQRLIEQAEGRGL